MPTTMHQEPFSVLAFENLLLYASFSKTPKIQFRGKYNNRKQRAITERDLFVLEF